MAEFGVVMAWSWCGDIGMVTLWRVGFDRAWVGFEFQWGCLIFCYGFLSFGFGWVGFWILI